MTGISIGRPDPLDPRGDLAVARPQADLRAAALREANAVTSDDIDGFLNEQGIDTDGVVAEGINSPDLDQIREGNHVAMRGQTGGAMAYLQSLLQDTGDYEGEIDGIFGGGQEAAVRAFQEREGLTVDGMIGDETLPILEQRALEARHATTLSHPDGPPDEEEVEEIIETAVDVLGVVPEMEAPEVDGDVGVVVGDPDAAPELGEAPALMIDPERVTEAPVVVDALQDAIRPGVEGFEEELLDAVGGEEGLAAGIDASLDKTLVPELYDDALYAIEQELATPDTPSPLGVEVPQERVEEIMGELRTAMSGELTTGGMAPNYAHEVLVEASDAEIRAVADAYPNIGPDLVASYARYEPSYAETIGRYFGDEETVDGWMESARAAVDPASDTYVSNYELNAQILRRNAPNQD